MPMELSANTQAILLLTAPLALGRRGSSSALEPLTPSEYRQLAQRLHVAEQEPAAFLKPDADDLVRECRGKLESERLKRLLGRGMLLSQAVERWQARAVWVASRADADYPRYLKQRLGSHAPPVLYGSGNATLLNAGGLAVVGSRRVDEVLIDYAARVGQLAAAAARNVVSGGARGIDQAAMCGALEAEGSAIGVLADSLDKAVLRRQYRDALAVGRLALVSPYDPAAGFKPWRAMERNKLIYALADAALVVNSDHGKGGTWTGAVEQLDKLRCVPIYVRASADGLATRGLAGLRERGAQPWPDPQAPGDLERVLDASLDVQRPNGGLGAPLPEAPAGTAVGNNKPQPEQTLRAQGSLPFGS